MFLWSRALSVFCPLSPQNFFVFGSSYIIIFQCDLELQRLRNGGFKSLSYSFFLIIKHSVNWVIFKVALMRGVSILNGP